MAYYKSNEKSLEHIKVDTGKNLCYNISTIEKHIVRAGANRLYAGVGKILYRLVNLEK